MSSNLRFFEPSTHTSLYTNKVSFDPARCPVTVTYGSSRAPSYSQCRMVLKEDAPIRPVHAGHHDLDMPVCKKHAGVYDRAKAKDDAWRAEADVSENQKARAQEHVRALAEVGIAAEPEWRRPFNGAGHYTGNVIVDGAEVLARFAAREES